MPKGKQSPENRRAGTDKRTCASRGVTKRSEMIGVRVEPEIKEWIEANGGSRFHYEILRERYQSHLPNAQE